MIKHYDTDRFSLVENPGHYFVINEKSINKPILLQCNAMAHIQSLDDSMSDDEKLQNLWDHFYPYFPQEMP